MAAPSVLNTGRWVCKNCLDVVPAGARVCPRCLESSFKPEYDPEALAAAKLRDERLLLQEED